MVSSARIVYNNFPWPSEVTAQRKAAIEEAAQNVLAARKAHKHMDLATLYDPFAMPKGVRQAHKVLDKEVDLAYSKRKFASDAERVAYLLVRYRDEADALQAAAKKPRRRRLFDKVL